MKQPWHPADCPACHGHLRVVRVVCDDCGLELHGDFGHLGAAPTEAAAPAGESPDPGSPRDQILARVASGELAPEVAATLLGQLED